VGTGFGRLEEPPVSIRVSRNETRNQSNFWNWIWKWNWVHDFKENQNQTGTGIPIFLKNHNHIGEFLKQK
jgi:hypothetical protein